MHVAATVDIQNVLLLHAFVFAEARHALSTTTSCDAASTATSACLMDQSSTFSASASGLDILTLPAHEEVRPVMISTVGALNRHAWLSSSRFNRDKPLPAINAAAGRSGLSLLPALPPPALHRDACSTGRASWDSDGDNAATVSHVTSIPAGPMSIMWLPMYMTLAERVILQTSACKLSVGTDGYVFGLLMDTKLPLVTTLIALSYMVRL